MGQNQSNYSWHKDDNVYKNGNGGFRGNGYQALEEDPMMLEATRARNLFIPSGVKLVDWFPNASEFSQKFGAIRYSPSTSYGAWQNIHTHKS